MCGIVGYLDYKHRLTDGHLDQMTDLLHHRGPDDRGTWTFQQDAFSLGFGHRRLSILDLSVSGHQPMHSPCGRYHIVYNGEVYNFSDIRQDLQALGVSFSSHSDTEVILASFIQWGTACVDRFIGMFAFCIFDAEAGQIYLFRDRCGVKPLYYGFFQDCFVFSSEIKPLLKIPFFERDIHLEAVSTFFKLSYIPAPHSIFKDVSKLEPGHYLSFDVATRALSTHCYWDVLSYYKQPSLTCSYEEAMAQTEALMKSSFQYRMVSDVPVGVFLSGGYDSAAVAALLQSESSTPLKTFTIGFDEKEFDEAPYAKDVAAHLGCEHTEYYCSQRDMLDLIDQVPFFCDEPFGDSSIIPTMLVSGVARKHVTVSLSADGADELFVGYAKYSSFSAHIERFRSLPGPLRSGGSALLHALNRLHPALKSSDFGRKLRHMAYVMGARTRSEELRYRIESKYIPFYDQKGLFLEPVSHGLPSAFDAFDQFDPEVSDLSQMLGVDFKTYMVDDILCKVDRASMSVSLESREPFLDQRLIEYVARLPNAYKFDGVTNKRILKDIVHRYIPKEMMDRPKKGFSVPILYWLRDELSDMVHDFLSPSYVRSQGLFHTAAIEGFLAEFNRFPNRYNAMRIWHLLMFNMWWDKWMRR